MRWTWTCVLSAGLACTGTLQAQGRAPQPPLVPCGQQGAMDILCGTRSPEDLEPTPDGKSIIVSQFVNAGRGGSAGAGIVLFDPAKKTYTKMTVSVEPLQTWGDPRCPGAIGGALVPHGISLIRRTDGKWQLDVVNHGGRESIEMFELRRAAGSWALAWHGCVVSGQAFNDVAALPNGGFYATHPTALQTPGFDLFSGKPSGYVSSWMPGTAETELTGTRFGYPNGVVAGPDGRYIYYNAWTAKEVHKYDLKEHKDAGVVKLDFMPDNLTWTKNKHLLAAGVVNARGECPPGSGKPCIQAWGIAGIDPATMDANNFDLNDKGAVISGVSVALQMGNFVYVGAFQGDRLVRFPWKNYPGLLR